MVRRPPPDAACFDRSCGVDEGVRAVVADQFQTNFRMAAREHSESRNQGRHVPPVEYRSHVEHDRVGLGRRGGHGGVDSLRDHMYALTSDAEPLDDLVTREA